MRLQAQGLYVLFQKRKHSRSIYCFLCSSCKCKHSTPDLSRFLSVQSFTHPGVPNETFAPGCSTTIRNGVIRVTRVDNTLQGLPCFLVLNMGCRELPPSCSAALAQVVQCSTVVMELLFTALIKQISLVGQETTHLAVRSKLVFYFLSTCSTFTGHPKEKALLTRSGSSSVCSGSVIAESWHWWAWVSDVSGACRVLCSEAGSSPSSLLDAFKIESYEHSVNKCNKHRLSQSSDSRDMMNLTSMISITWCFTQSITE